MKKTTVILIIFMAGLTACNSGHKQDTITLDALLHMTSVESADLDTLAMLADGYIAANNRAEAVKVFRKMGKINRESNNFIEAIKYHHMAMELAEAIGDEDEIILGLNQIGTDYRRIAAYEEATTYHYRALKRCEQYGGAPDFALKHKVMSLNGIGNIYLKLNNLNEAESILRRALEGETQLKSYLGMAINYANLGSIFEARQQYDSARVYYERSMEYNRRANSRLGISLCHNHFGRLAEAKGDYVTALREYHAAYSIMDKTADRVQWLKACLSIVRVNITIGDMDAAALYLSRAEETSLKLKANDHLATMYDLKYRYFEKKGDFRQALKNYITAKCYADSTLNLRNVNHINDLRVLYETEKNELKIEAMEERQQFTVWLGITGGLLLLLILIFFIIRQRLAVNKRKLAEQQIKQLEQEKQLIATQAVLDGEVQERTRLACDLHDSLGSILAAAKYNLVDIKKISLLGEEDMKRYQKVVSLLDDSMNEMRRVAHHLMPDSLSRIGLKQSVADFCKTIPIVKFSYYGDDTRFNPKLEVMVYRILHELVTNAIKHAKAESIFVQIVRESDRIAISVQDNGCGFDPTAESKGMGLRNIRARVESCKGNLDIDSQPGKGTGIRVELKIW